MKNKKKFTLRNIIFLILATFFLFSIIRGLVLPSARFGPFGIGLPAPFTTYKGQYLTFSIQYPDSWVVFEFPGGEHGDKNVIAGIQSPGRSFPRIRIIRKRFDDENISQVAYWGEERVKGKRSYQEISIKNYRTSKYEGLVRTYEYEVPSLFGSTDIRCFDYYLFDQSIGYILSFCDQMDQKSKEVVEDVFHHMLESFDIE